MDVTLQQSLKDYRMPALRRSAPLRTPGQASQTSVVIAARPDEGHCPTARADKPGDCLTRAVLFPQKNSSTPRQHWNGTNAGAQLPRPQNHKRATSLLRRSLPTAPLPKPSPCHETTARATHVTRSQTRRIRPVGLSSSWPPFAASPKQPCSRSRDMTPAVYSPFAFYSPDFHDATSPSICLAMHFPMA